FKCSEPFSVLRINFDRPRVVRNGQSLVSVGGIGLAQAVVDVGGLRMLLRVQLQDLDRVFDVSRTKQIQTETVQLIFRQPFGLLSALAPGEVVTKSRYGAIGHELSEKDAAW